MYNSKQLTQKWSEILESEDLPKINDPFKRAITSVLLENQEKASYNGDEYISEDTANAAGAGVTYNGNPNLKGIDPVLIPMVRRLAPNLMAFDIMGVQPMTGPINLIFAMKARYGTQAGSEALHFEANTAYSGTSGGHTHTVPLDPFDPALDRGVGYTLAQGEQLGAGGANPTIPEMALSIDRVSVTAKTRALKAEFTTELRDDLKKIHGLDAEAELANILATELAADINREAVRTIYYCAVAGAQHNVTTPGTFDLDDDSNGRWMVEKFKGLMFQLDRDANQIAKETRRGKGNFVITSSDVASALSMAGLLDYCTNLRDNLSVDDTGNTYVGKLNGRMDVFIDPYFVTSDTNFYCVGYKGKTAYDAGLFYCPYIPLQLVRALDPSTLQPKLGFKTRYGMVANPFSNINGDSNGALVTNSNVFYRKVKVEHLM